MKPALHHRLLAHTANFSATVGVLVALGLFGRFLNEEGAMTGDPAVIGWILVAAVPIAGIGYIVGVILIWGVLGGVAARIQGWPFEKGDEVVILAGKDKGRVATVYEVWKERGQVRLEMGEEAKKSVTDVFCAVSVTRTAKCPARF